MHPTVPMAASTKREPGRLTITTLSLQSKPRHAHLLQYGCDMHGRVIHHKLLLHVSHGKTPAIAPVDGSLIILVIIITIVVVGIIITRVGRSR